MCDICVLMYITSKRIELRFCGKLRELQYRSYKDVPRLKEYSFVEVILGSFKIKFDNVSKKLQNDIKNVAKIMAKSIM